MRERIAGTRIASPARSGAGGRNPPPAPLSITIRRPVPAGPDQRPQETSMPTPLPVRRTGNPGLNEKTFANLPRPLVGEGRMTLQGTVNKSFLMLVVLLAGALWPWSQYMSTGDASVVSTSVLIGLLGGLVL